MKLLNVLAVFAFIAMAKGAVTQCNFCLENTLEECKTEGEMFDCSNNTFPNFGTTHCYTASGNYMEGGMKKSGVARGCGNCSGNAFSEANLKLFEQKFNAQQNATLDTSSSNIVCCDDANNCNNHTVSPLSPTATTTTTSGSIAPPGGKGPDTTPTSHATRLFPISGIVAFVAIILAVTL